ncbi:MAG: universal stress protein [Alphaproteobacteria bacterium]|nr:universal stress protein [Alphaproteobacteria bacterium]
MNPKTLMAHVELGQSNAGLLAITTDLARQFKAHVIGVASCQPMRLDWQDAYVTAGLLAEDRKEIEKQMGAAEKELRTALGGKIAGVEWRSTVTLGSLADYIALQARAADLVITGTEIAGSILDHTRRVGIADLVMEAGRPILVIPKRVKQLSFDHVLVAWKNTRESRRAASDALPLLKLAKKVTVSEIARDEDMSRAKHHIADVVGWLGRHGIEAVGQAVVSTSADSERLREIAADGGVDLIVAGAYGHSRLREWVLGGVTGDFLLDPDRCVFISH